MLNIIKNYMVKRVTNFFKTIRYASEMAGMVRAAQELHRMGYEREYKITMDRIRTMKSCD